MVNGLEYTKRVSLFGENLSKFGKTLLFFFSVLSSLFFWFIIFTHYEGYQEIAVTMINFLRMSVLVLFVGLFLKTFFYSLNVLIMKRKLKKVNFKTK